MKIHPADRIRKLPYLLGLVGILFSLASFPSPHPAGPAAPVTGQAPASAGSADAIQDYGAVDETGGWVLLDDHLYWTGDNGVTWNNITPDFPPGASIYAVTFLDKEAGRLLSSALDPDGNIEFQVAATTDAGLHWDFSTLQILPVSDLDANVESASMTWLDETTGWVSIKRSTGQNFSLGTLFRTQDGGKTWLRLTLPIGEPVVFSDVLHGWVAGGPASDQLFKTQDGGLTWEKLALPAQISGPIYLMKYFPILNSMENGLLLVASTDGMLNTLEIFSTSDGGDNWLEESSMDIDTSGGDIPLSFFGLQNIMIVVPGGDRILKMGNGGLEESTNQDGASAAIVGLEMISSTSGWAKWNTSACALQTAAGPDDPTDLSCTSVNKLIRTEDGGLTWKAIELPETGSTFLAQRSSSSFAAQPEGSGQGNTQAFVGQGFDKCEIPTAAQLQTWWNTSPYKIVNLYIGGSSRSCPNTSLSSSYLDSLSRQGWKFIPTWVGMQAPCSSFNSRFSSNPATAYTQGVSEANAALDKLASLGLTKSDGTGSVVYYDLEGYPDDAGCTNAVKSFMNGWGAQIHSRSSLAGVYGSPCTSGLNNFLTIANVPDVVWLAVWYHSAGSGSYDPDASVWDVPCLGNGYWTTHQRLRQYEGGHGETWGSLTLTIDNDVFDGVVAIYTTCDATSLPSGYIQCSDQGGFCSFSGTQSVYYGAPGCYKVKTFTSGIGCNNDNFGDPLAGASKACYINDPAPSCPQSGGVILYWNANYACNNSFGDAGYRLQASPGFLDVNDGSFDNQASSVRVPAGWSVMLYERSGHAGGRVCINSDTSDLGFQGNFPGTSVSIDNNVSSIQVFPNDSCSYRVFLPVMHR